MSPIFSKQMRWLRGVWPPNFGEAGSYSPAATEEQHLASSDMPRSEENGERDKGRASVSRDAYSGKLEGDCTSSLDSCPTSIPEQHQRPRRRSKALQWAWKLLLILLALWGAVDLVRHAVSALAARRLHPISDASHWCRKACPQSLREATALDCVFDELENRFTKRECINAEITAAFTRAGPGPGGAWFYRTEEVDGNMTTVDVGRVVELIGPGRVVWQTTRWHLLHCMFVWRKISLARFDGTLLPMGREEEARHGEHCERLVASFLVGEEMDEYLAHTEY